MVHEAPGGRPFRLGANVALLPRGNRGSSQRAGRQAGECQQRRLLWRQLQLHTHADFIFKSELGQNRAG